MIIKPAQLDVSSPIVDESGKMSDRFRFWAQAITNQTLVVGVGSPEGVVSASQYTLYIDETTPTVPVQYRKMLVEITGDRSKGWIAV